MIVLKKSLNAWLCAAVSLSLLPEGCVWADPPIGYVTPSLTLGRGYDDNLFYSNISPQSSAFWRLSPALEAGLLSGPLTMAGYYSQDAERYADHPELDSNAVRRRSSLNLDDEVGPRLDLKFNGDYTSTATPAEISPSAGLGFGRARARVYVAKPSLDYEFSPVTLGRASYTYTKDELDAGSNAEERDGTLGLDHGIDPRDTLSFDYVSSRFYFSGQSPTESQVYTFGWTRALGPNTTASVKAGPRYTEGAYSPELSVRLVHINGPWSTRLDYARSQSVVIGAVRPVDVRTYAAGLDYVSGIYFEFHVTPSYTSDRIGGSTSDLYRLNLDCRRRLNPSISLVASYQYTLQHGLLGGIGGEEFKDDLIFVALEFALPGTTVNPFPQRSLSPYEPSWPETPEPPPQPLEPPASPPPSAPP